MQVIWYQRKTPPTHVPLRYDLLGFDRKSETLWLPEFLPADDVMGLVDRALGDDVIDLYDYDEILWEVRAGPFSCEELDLWCGWMDHPLSRVNYPRQWPEEVAPFRVEPYPADVRARLLDVRLLEEDPLNDPFDGGILHVWVLLQTCSSADAFVVDPCVTALVRRDGTPVVRPFHGQDPHALVPAPAERIAGIADLRWVSWVQLLTFRRPAEAENLCLPEGTELRIGVIGFDLEPVVLTIPADSDWPCSAQAEGLRIEIQDFGIGRMEPHVECNHLRYRRDDELLSPYHPEHPVLVWKMCVSLPDWLPASTDANPFYGVEALCEAGMRPRFALHDMSGDEHGGYFMSTSLSSDSPTTVTGECHFLSLREAPALTAIVVKTVRPTSRAGACLEI